VALTATFGRCRTVIPGYSETMFNSRRIAWEDSWEGTVLKKKHSMTDGSNMYHYVEVRLSDGESKKFRISGHLWGSLAEGDDIVKVAGSDPVRN
jgi:hypothetical protein